MLLVLVMRSTPASASASTASSTGATTGPTTGSSTGSSTTTREARCRACSGRGGSSNARPRGCTCLVHRQHTTLPSRCQTGACSTVVSTLRAL